MADRGHESFLAINSRLSFKNVRREHTLPSAVEETSGISPESEPHGLL